MNITCPNCGEVFSLDNDMAANLKNHLRDELFEKDLADRMRFYENSMNASAELKIREALDNERKKHDEQVSELQAVIADLKARSDFAGKETEIAVKQAQMACDEKYGRQIFDMSERLQAKDAEIAYYRDLKLKMSTKMIGESLEQHCETEFNKIRMAAFPNAYFEKDNAVSSSGSKGDYIFRELDADGNDIVSIMFEMKNEVDATVTKKKNEHFFKELDKDRREKNCEYAVLVSLLESDSEYYNQGIVDVSYRYPKMYVIRPQFFVPIITLLRNMALNIASARAEAQALREQNADLTHFSQNFDMFCGQIRDVQTMASKKAVTALDEINKAIKRLESARSAIESVIKMTDKSVSTISDITVEKLCDGGGLPSVVKG